MLDRPKILRNSVFSDKRGHLLNLSHDEIWSDFHVKHQCVSFNSASFTARGLHLQVGSAKQSKILTCLSGSLIDFVVNVKLGDQNFGQVEIFELSSDTGDGIFIPADYAHGFITTTTDTILHYNLDNYFEPQQAMTLSLFDPELEISMPCARDQLILSEKDLAGISLSELEVTLNALRKNELQFSKG